jgi:predicted ArsR family transcriptional regulator
LVTRKGLQPGKRRPHEVYQLTRRAGEMLVHPSDAAFSAILTALKRALPPQQFKDLLGGGGAALAERFIAGDPARPLARRVRTAERLLRTLGGAPAVEERESGFCIRSRACPLAAVVAEHPETCQLVEQLLGHVIRAPVSEHCLRNGKSQCRFEVAKNEG